MINKLLDGNERVIFNAAKSNFLDCSWPAMTMILFEPQVMSIVFAKLHLLVYVKVKSPVDLNLSTLMPGDIDGSNRLIITFFIH